MKTKSLILLFVSALMITKGFSIPSLINYQGRLTDNNGAAVANSQLNVSVSIYDVLSGGDALHTENLQNVETDENGVYAFQFGDGMQSILEDNESLWLEITIEGDTLSPRQQLLAVPYASVAKSLEDGATLGNISLTGDLGARRVNVDQTLSVDGMSDLEEVYARRLSVYGQIDGSGALVDFSNASSIRVPAPQGLSTRSYGKCVRL